MPGSSEGGNGERRRVEAVAPAKLNLGLAVLGRRRDGYHDLRTIFQAIDLADTLQFRDAAGPGIRLRVAGTEAVPGGPENLVVRAAERIRRRRAPGRGADILLEKRIPAGGGLGGGSSDAAATLLALEALWGLDPDPVERAATALELGSDVPFFLQGGTARGEGRGERLTPLPPPPTCAWVLVIPAFRISTAEAYRELLQPLTGSEATLRILEAAIYGGDFKGFAKNLVNDLEVGVVRIQPRLARIRQEVLARGAANVVLTGSGSVLFAVFETQGKADSLLREDPLPGDAAVLPCAPVDHGARVIVRSV